MSDRRARILNAIADAGRPLWNKEVTAALGESGDCRNDELNRSALSRMVADGLLTKSGDYKKRFSLTAQGYAAAGRAVPADAPIATVDAEDLFEPVVLVREIKHHVRSRGITDSDLAAELRISRAGLSHILAGESRPSVETFLRMLRWMGVRRFEVDAFSARRA